jgi:ATPase family associated with various cellular activities (AAA)
MYGFKLKYLRTSVLLLAALVALSVAWSYLSPVVLLLVITGGLILLLSITVGRNAWTQTQPGDSEVALMPPRRGGIFAAVPARRRRRAEVLPPEATVSLAEERRAADIEDVFSALDQQLIGLVPVKKKVDEVASLLLVDRVRQRFGLQAPRPNLHMCFTGDPGTGKTTVALKMADLLNRLGYLEKGHLVHAMRDDLVGEFIGQTAPKTKRVLERRWAESFSLTRPIICTVPLIRRTTARNASTSCSRSWRTTGTS